MHLGRPQASTHPHTSWHVPPHHPLAASLPNCTGVHSYSSTCPWGSGYQHKPLQTSAELRLAAGQPAAKGESRVKTPEVCTRDPTNRPLFLDHRRRGLAAYPSHMYTYTEVYPESSTFSHMAGSGAATRLQQSKGNQGCHCSAAQAVMASSNVTASSALSCAQTPAGSARHQQGTAWCTRTTVVAGLHVVVTRPANPTCGNPKPCRSQYLSLLCQLHRHRYRVSALSQAPDQRGSAT